MSTRLPAYASSEVEDVDRFFLDMAPDPNNDLAVSWGGRERCGADYLVERPGLHLMTIEFVAEGRGKLMLRGREHPLRCGSAFCYGPGIPHRIEGDRDSPMVKFFVNFTGREAKPLLDAGPLRDGGPCDVAEPGAIIGVFDQLIHEGKLGHTRIAHDICAAYLRLLILQIRARSIPNRIAKSRSLETFERAKRYIHERSLTFTRVAQIAESVGVSESYLSRLFKQFEGISPYAYLTRLRLNHAAQLLTTTRLSVGDVATRLGFSDQFLFSRAFKRQFDIPPITFRKNNSATVRPTAAPT